MTHAYVARFASEDAEPLRLQRLRDRGWKTDTLNTGCDLATTGAAQVCRRGDLVAAGLVFLEDRDAVSAQLGLTPPEVAELSDLDLLLRLVEAKGTDLAREVAGSVSVLVHDRRNGRTDAWRDRLGLYPFYYVFADGTLTCGSDIRACLHLSGIALRPDKTRIADFVHGADVDLDRTAFDGLKRLPPAYRLEWRGKEADIADYWQLSLPMPVSSKNAPSELRTSLELATAACLRSGETVGAMLSGGLDSSALAGLAARIAEPPLRTLSFVYGPDEPYDETPYIDAANAAFGASGHAIPIDRPPQLEEIQPLVEEQMELFLAPGLQKSRRIYSEGHALGIDTLIDGHGGDEVISHGYGRLVELASRRAFRQLFREARGAARVHGVPFLALFAGHVGQYAGLRRGNPLRRALLKLARTLTRRAAISGWSEGPDTLIAPGLRARVDAEQRYRPRPPLASREEFARVEGIAHLRALTDPLMVHSLEVLHRSATAAGIVPRYPFFDRRVVSLCLALPSDTKLRDGRSRWILREAMLGVLPETIRQRTDKAEFGEEFRRSVTEFYDGKDASVFDPLGDFVDVAAANRLREAVMSGSLEDVAALRALWRLAVLIHWLPAFENWCAAQNEGTLI